MMSLLRTLVALSVVNFIAKLIGNGKWKMENGKWKIIISLCQTKGQTDFFIFHFPFSIFHFFIFALNILEKRLGNVNVFCTYILFDLD